MIVVDTNILVYLVDEGPRTREAERVFQRDPHWIVPILWQHEFRNVLATRIRVTGLDLAIGLDIYRQASRLLEDREFSTAGDRVLELASVSGISAYDCEFVALAMERRIPLVSQDRKMRKAFPDVVRSMEQFLA